MPAQTDTFDWLDYQIHKNGDYLFMALVYTMPFVMAWILVRSSRRKPRREKSAILSGPSSSSSSDCHLNYHLDRRNISTHSRRTKNHRAATTTTTIARTECGQIAQTQSRS
jgi:hypothetical protein